MADKTISALTSATTPLAGTEVLPIVQSSTTVKVAVSDLTAGRSITVSGIANSDGTVALPAYSFTSNTNTGIYRIGTNNIGISANGAKVVDIATTGAAITGTLSATGNISTSTGNISTTGAKELQALAGAQFRLQNAAASANWNFSTSGTTLTLNSPQAGNFSVTNLFLPIQATTAAAPSYVKGAIYFDTTLNKLRVGGATAWETITSV
jgi:hypothetical protein